MGNKPVRYLLVILLIMVIVSTLVSAHPPSDMTIIYDPDSGSILVTVSHPVSDLSSHYVNEIILRKNGVTMDTITYTSQPSADTFTYRYLMPLQAGDAVSVTARCSIGGEITRQYASSGHAVPVTVPSQQASTWSYSSLWPIHAACMTAGFLCFLASALLPVYGKRLKGWYRLHTGVSGAGAILTILALGISFAMVSLSGGPNFRVPHAYLGLVVMIVLMLVLGLAFLRSSVPVDRKAAIRTLHLWLGRLLVVLMAGNIVMGMKTAGLLG